MLTIRNASAYAANYKYIVYNLVGGEAWFFSAWNDLMKASEQAHEYGLYITERAQCELEVW